MAFDQPDSFQIGPFEVRQNPSPRELAEKLNKLREAVEQLRIQPGPGYTINRTRGGTTIQILRQPGGGAGAAEDPCAFDMTITPTTAGLNISFHPGLVNGILPASMFASPQLTGVATAGVKYCWITCDTNGKNVTSCSFAYSTSPPTVVTATADVAPSQFNVLVGVVSGSTPFRTIPCGNITARVSPTVQEDRAYVAGERSFSQYYQWIF